MKNTKIWYLTYATKGGMIVPYVTTNAHAKTDLITMTEADTKETAIKIFTKAELLCRYDGLDAPYYSLSLKAVCHIIGSTPKP